MFKYYIFHSFVKYAHDGHSHCFNFEKERQQFEISREHAVSILTEGDIWSMEQTAKHKDGFGFSEYGTDRWFLETRDGFHKGDELVVEHSPSVFNYTALYSHGDPVVVLRSHLLDFIGEPRVLKMEECAAGGGHLVYVIGGVEYRAELAE